ncbi:hypothetical protein B0A48_13999 [Cryoendolithus antarcticus]|uniref:OTU domain-containing protein n=1 Tax=Cryoendolithus antarcticus TaxID=1507870 RepID=A0A1V8SMW2_9PEZI|nr:hypothetical protein B0A48_13999 [Cryoendolithus antarcticus]
MPANSSADEFPLLHALGLYAADINGDGNCLFNALSDQMYGNQASHVNIRAHVIEYMREHAAYYKQFIDVQPGGGTRRNPKRKNAGAYSTPTNFTPPSEADIDRVFDRHLQAMAKGGTYGDNMEITAFSSALGWDVKIYQRDFAYMISGAGEAGGDDTRPVAHIAYHTWEHYSSIRNVHGPHSGLPEVRPTVLSPEEEALQREKMAATPYVAQAWEIDRVASVLTFLTDKPAIRRALEASRGNIDRAANILMEAEENFSASSAQESSSVERDQESEDDGHAGPNKKQDRRMSRASRKDKPRSQESKHAFSRLQIVHDSQESISSSWESEASSQPDDGTNTDNMSFSTIASQEPDAASNPPRKPSIKLKLHGPKPPLSSDPLHRPPSGKTSLLQPGPRPTARDRKDIKKQAQKAARKERQQVALREQNGVAAMAAGLELRKSGMTETPPLETLRTLYI